MPEDIDSPQETNSYPHQLNDDVTADRLLLHYRSHPEMYHDSIRPHIVRITGATEMADLMVKGVIDAPLNDNPEVAEQDKINQLIIKDMVNLLKLVSWTEGYNYEIERHLETAMELLNLSDNEYQIKVNEYQFKDKYDSLLKFIK